MITRLPSREPSAYDDDFEGQPPQGWFYKWFLGVALPLLFVAVGSHAVIAQHQYLPGQTPMMLTGTNAVAYGVAAISLGVAFHSHYFWGNVYDQSWFAVLGKILGLCGFIGGLGVWILRSFLLGH